MKLDNLRQLVKEELKRTLTKNTPKYIKGDTFIYMGSKYLVVSDDGFIIKAMSPSGRIVKINYGQLKDRVSENTMGIDFKNTPKEKLEAGTYIIDFITQDPDGGGPDKPDSHAVELSKEDILNDFNSNPLNMWEDIAQNIPGFKIYKIDKVTKV